jgi:dTDP-4-dehydrorhamnose reductase
MGATKPYFENCSDISVPLYANAVFPHQLTQWSELMPGNTNVIHITTDCVYDGIIGRYDEYAPHSAQDMYGKSKSLGEPENCMVIRTSIIGPEFGGKTRHFLSWVKSLDGKDQESYGYNNHLWNGLTTLELAYAISDIVCNYIYDIGTYHLYSSDITKYEMVRGIADVYNLDINLKKVNASQDVDRRLRTSKELNSVISPVSFESMLEELKEWEELEYERLTF